MEKIAIFVLLTISLFLGSSKCQIPDTEFTINEELKVTTVVGNISDLPGLFPGTTDEIRKSLQYGILDQVSKPASLFNITRDGGVLYVAGRIDREQQCLGLEKCVLKLNILVSSRVPSQFDSKVVTVYFIVNDINDNPPEFGRQEVVLEVTEGNALNSVLKITGANDRDYIEEFKTQNYTLDAFDDVFELTASQTLDGSSEIDLKLKKSLDREIKDGYDFSITAYDGGIPALTAVLRVVVVVTDKNDNPPVFLNASYGVTIDGEVVQGAFIVQVSARDDDIGDNGKITYDFSSLQKSMLKHSFQIDRVSGEISAIGNLNSKTFNFIVEAQDAGSPPLKAQTEVTVVVINSGNAPPVVTITTLGTNMEDNTISILEPGGRGLFVAFVDVSDDVDGVLCEISNDVFRMEPIKNKGYKISLQGTIDRETRELYNLSVICIDAGEPPLQSVAQFFVKVLDANDNVPKFNQERYSRTLSEGKKNGEYVLQVSASDRDTGNNGIIKYSLDPNYREFFTIHPTTGIITAVGELDRETTSVLSFSVYATDRGSPPLQSSTQVSIFLEDINDNAPTFDKKVFKFKAREEVKGYRIINDLSAKDKDAGVNGEMEYFFTGSTDGADNFFTVKTNGSIVSSRPLDREDRQNYTFSVMVRDKGNPPLMSSARVIVEITDINDNTPEILFPDTKPHHIPIRNVPERGVLTLISAHDNDAGENGSLKFTIVAGNEDRAFEINQSTGEFKIARASRLKNHKRYNVEIVVSDRGSPPKANTTTLIIEVDYKNVTKAQREKEEDYIIIVAVVAAVTVVFSSLIIAAICIVFQKDRNSRQKPIPPKASFHNIHNINLSDDDKVNVNTDIPSHLQNGHDFSTNDLSRSQEGSKDQQNSQYFQTKFAFIDAQNVPKGKAVSFSMDHEDIGKSKFKPQPLFNTSSPRDTPPPLSTFGSNRIRPSDDDIFLQPTPMTRQVSGVTYAPVSTNGHGDDVKSDTSADTTTSDSGRGNSVDDVTFEYVLKGELSPGINSRRHSGEPELPPRWPIHTESERHVTFSRSCDNSTPDRSSPAHTRSNFPKYYSGGQVNQKNKYPNYGDKDQSKHRIGSSCPNSSKLNNNYSNPKLSKLSTFSNASRHISMNSVDDDATTTTSGSYVINPDDVKMETYIGSDVVV